MRSLLFCLSLSILLSNVATAAIFYWDTDSITAGLQSGSGSWSAGGGNWDSAGDGTVPSTWTDGNEGRFNDSGYTVTLGSNILAQKVSNYAGAGGGQVTYDLNTHQLTFNASGNNIQYNNRNATFTNGSIALARNSQFSVGAGIASTNIVTLSANIAGSTFTIAKTGHATLELGGSNVYGDTAVNLGTLSVLSGSSLGSGNITFHNNNVATLDLQTASAIADTATLAMFNNSALNLNYAGTEVVGTLTIEGNTVADGTYTAAELNALGHGGTFSGTGSLQVGAVPEPSTYALLFGTLCMGVAILKRRHQKRS